MSEVEQTTEAFLSNYSVSPADFEDMKVYLHSALSVITFKIVYDENDLKKPSKRTNCFKPEMAHQVFGDNEMIFGYKHLTITLNYLHNSAKCFVEIAHTGKFESSSGGATSSSGNDNKLESDDIEQYLDPWLPAKYTKDMDVFTKQINDEVHDKIFGEVIHEFQSGDKTYKVTLCDTSDPEFREFHQRFETFLVWFIDGANPIDLSDFRWTVFYVYEEEKDTKTNQIRCSPIGLCTVYKFYLGLNQIRPRISQFFVLPTHQKRGIGTTLYRTVFKYLKAMPDVLDITVEEPTDIFQRIRDFCDCLRVHEDLKENSVEITKENNSKMKIFMKNNKIGKKQCQRIVDILSCLAAEKGGRRDEFNRNIKKRIEAELTKESRGSKRMCNADRAGIAVESANLNERIDDEYQRYTESLEWPVKQLSCHLSNNVAGKSNC